MGLTVSSGKIGFAYLVDGELMDWRLSIDASQSADAAFDKAKKWIGYYELDMLVLEAPEASRKGQHSRRLSDAAARAAKELGVPVVHWHRESREANKYDEAAGLAIEFPQVAAWLPRKRQLWEKEPRYIILFEALALAWDWWRRSGAQNEDDIIDW